MKSRILVLGLLAGVLAAAGGPEPREQANAALLDHITVVHHLDAGQAAAVAAVFAASDRLGQGNPAITQHPMTPEQCVARRAGLSDADPEAERICGGPYMAPLYDPANQQPDDATACIDRYEFPDIPCAYPVTWVQAREAAEICSAMGKRLCDAHEWEGACAGSLQPPDYRFDLAIGQTSVNAVRRMRDAHNKKWGPTKAWAYGPAYEKGVCGAASTKAENCNGGDWAHCGSNTYPAGAFPNCVSALGVYDQHGNAAEHMNLPLRPDQMSSTGSSTLGVTEMKGSWFIFDRYYAHPDWCRWRAPYWHGGPVLDSDSHRNYHLGFRCCKTRPTAP